MNDDELQALLRGADPATRLPPADRAWVTDHLEDAVITTRPTPVDEAHDAAGTARAARRRRPWLVGTAVAVGVAAAAAVVTPVALSRAPGLPAVSTTLTAAGGGGGAAFDCPPVAQVLPTTDTAFQGRAVQVDGDRVLLAVDRVYRGEPGEGVALVADQQGTASTVGGFPFEVGQEYLVSASQGTVAVCGGSGPVTPELQAEYDRAFGG